MEAAFELKEVAVVIVAVGVDLLDESVFLAHLHLHSDPFAWQAPCIHHAVVEAAGLEADLELVVEFVVDAAEADGLEAGLELVVALAVWNVVDQEAIFEVVAAKKVGVRVVEVLGDIDAVVEGAVDQDAVVFFEV